MNPETMTEYFGLLLAFVSVPAVLIALLIGSAS